MCVWFGGGVKKNRLEELASVWEGPLLWTDVAEAFGFDRGQPLRSGWPCCSSLQKACFLLRRVVGDSTQSRPTQLAYSSHGPWFPFLFLLLFVLLAFFYARKQVAFSNFPGVHAEPDWWVTGYVEPDENIFFFYLKPTWRPFFKPLKIRIRTFIFRNKCMGVESLVIYRCKFLEWNVLNFRLCQNEKSAFCYRWTVICWNLDFIIFFWGLNTWYFVLKIYIVSEYNIVYIPIF
jgi:hypothetical protein